MRVAAVNVLDLIDEKARPALAALRRATRDESRYVRDVAGSLGAAPYGVMTTFTFDEKFDYPSVRCTDPVTLNDDQLAYVFSKRDDALAMLMVEPDVSEFQAKVVEARNKPKGRAAAATGKVATGGRRKAA